MDGRTHVRIGDIIRRRQWPAKVDRENVPMAVAARPFGSSLISQTVTTTELRIYFAVLILTT